MRQTDRHHETERRTPASLNAFRWRMTVAFMYAVNTPHPSYSAVSTSVWQSWLSYSIDTRNYPIRYDTIRDAILTCAQKPTWVSLIYRTEPTAKKCKTEKLKRKKRICSEVTVTVWESCSQSRRRERKAAVGRICRKGRFKVWNVRESGWWKTNNNKYNC